MSKNPQGINLSMLHKTNHLINFPKIGNNQPIIHSAYHKQHQATPLTKINKMKTYNAVSSSKHSHFSECLTILSPFNNDPIFLCKYSFFNKFGIIKSLKQSLSRVIHSRVPACCLQVSRMRLYLLFYCWLIILWSS